MKPLSFSMASDLNTHFVGHTYHALSTTLSNDFVISEVGDSSALLKHFCNLQRRWLCERNVASYGQVRYSEWQQRWSGEIVRHERSVNLHYGLSFCPSLSIGLSFCPSLSIG